ncbi:hypothetical protein ACU4GD_00015 [Cupriavidus basilensis]
MLLPIAPRTEDDIARLVRALDIPVTLSAGTGLVPSPSAASLPLERLRGLGVRRVSLTTLLPGAAVAGMRRSLDAMRSGAGSGDDGGMAAEGAASLGALFHAQDQMAFEEALLL